MVNKIKIFIAFMHAKVKYKSLMVKVGETVEKYSDVESMEFNIKGLGPQKPRRVFLIFCHIICQCKFVF